MNDAAQPTAEGEAIGRVALPSFAVRQRAETIERLTADTLDVLVIGGGIVGAGVVRDAAMRGLRVGLVEQHDFAFGTSSRSSRLLHGGLRYLAQGRIGLVREASREKCILHRIAPHLAAPLPFVFPTYRGTKWPLWQLRIGVKLYDLLCGGRNLGRSSALSPTDVERAFPGIVANGLTGAVRYFDGLTSDSRLVIDSLRSAAHYGAMVANYSRLEHAAVAENGHWACQIRDVFTGNAYELTARNVVNATGPWAPGVRPSNVKLRLTKGVHLVVDQSRFLMPEACVMAEGDRILFAIPWGQRVILGTTDTDYSGSLDAVPIEDGDVAYILDVVNHSFPAAGLNTADVLGRWAGVRPLIATGSGGPSDISRAHQITSPAPGWLDVVGGKLTTYRLIGEQVVDRLAARTVKQLLRCRTAEEPLLAWASPDAAMRSSIVPPLPNEELVRHYCRHEWAVSADDIMLRRAGWRHYYQDDAAIERDVLAWINDCRDA